MGYVWQKSLKVSRSSVLFLTSGLQAWAWTRLRWIHPPTTIRQYKDDNAIVRCDGDLAITRWRQYDNATMRYCDGDNAIVLSHYRIVALHYRSSSSLYRIVAISLSHSRIIVLSSSRYHTVAIALHYRIVVIALFNCRHRTVALLPSGL
jgi:hypothetical protein